MRPLLLDLNPTVASILDVAMAQAGDIVNVDVTAYYKGFHGDLNETFVVGEVDTESQKLTKVAYEVPPCAD